MRVFFCIETLSKRYCPNYAIALFYVSKKLPNHYLTIAAEIDVVMLLYRLENLEIGDLLLSVKKLKPVQVQHRQFLSWCKRIFALLDVSFQIFH